MQTQLWQYLLLLRVLLPNLVLVDGNRTPAGLQIPAQPVVKGDATSASIGAASVLAKVSRDRYMLELDKQYAFPKDSSLKILTSGLLGEQYIGIEAGADENNLAAGDNLTATQSAVVLENLIGQFLYSKAEEGGTPSDAGRKK